MSPIPELVLVALDPRRSWVERLAAIRQLADAVSMSPYLAPALRAERQRTHRALILEGLQRGGGRLDIEGTLRVIPMDLGLPMGMARSLREEEIWGKGGAPTHPRDPRLHLPAAQRPPRGTPRIAFVALRKQGLSKEEAIEELRLRRCARENHREGRLEEVPGTCGICESGPGPFLTNPDISGCEGCGRRSAPCP